MDISDWISIGVAFLIGFFQIWQNKRLSDFEHRQDKRDETRHAASVKSQAISFISKNYSNRGLIPLCAIAAMHNDLYYYSREMYRELLYDYGSAKLYLGILQIRLACNRRKQYF